VRIREAAELFFDHLERRHLSAALKKRADHVLPRLFSHLRQRRVYDLRQANEADLVSFAKTLLYLKPWSQSAYLSLVKSFFQLLEGRGRLLRNPASILAIPKARRLARPVLTNNEAQRLMESPLSDAQLGKRDRAVLELMYGSGLRREECSRLDLIDVDLVSSVARVREGKGRKDRLVPLTSRACGAIATYLKEERPSLSRGSREAALFLTMFRQRLSGQSITNLVKKHARAAGLSKKVSSHSLRHACATHLLRGGADIRHIQAILGHRFLRTTALYAEVEAKDLKTAIGKAHPRPRWKRPREG